jgi:hypothetical protein
MNGKPNFALYASFRRWKRMNSCSVSVSSPALACSPFESSVIAPARRGPYRPHHGRVQVDHCRERPPGMRGGGDPWGELERLADGGLEGCKIHAIEIGESHGHTRRTSTPTRRSL